MVYSQDLERQVIGGLIKFQEIYPEVSSYLDEEDFATDINKNLYSIIRNALGNSQSLDKTIIATRLKSLGMSFRDNLDPYEYIDGLGSIQATSNSIVQAVRDLKTITKRRNYIEVCDRIKRKLHKDGNMSYDEITSFVDKEFYSQVSSWSSSEDSIDLFESMEARIEELGNNPMEDMGIATPYPFYNKRYGGLRNGNVYVFCARPKQGKTTFLDATAHYMANCGTNRIPCLILDTEMQTEEIQERMLSMVSGVPTWYITTGNWRKVPEFVPKIRNAWKLIKENRYKLHHKYVINKPIDQIVNEIKRWYYTKVGRGNQALIVYDYIKITGEALAEHNKEFQVIGQKVNTLKELVGKEVKAPLLSACQINRGGVNAESDDSSVIALSDRVLWFASQVSIFRRKTATEIQTETDQFGTHKLINIESRWQGREAAGHIDYVKDLQGNLINNFTNFTVKDFQVTENKDANHMFNVLGGKAKVEEKEEAPNPFKDGPEGNA